jgi:outer membrane protein TolC
MTSSLRSLTSPIARRSAALLVAALALASAPAYSMASSSQRTVTLEDAVRIALAGNSRLVAAHLSLEGEQEGLDAARSDFDLKLVPTLRLGKIGDNTLSSGTVGANNSLGAQLSKRFETGTTIAIGPSWNQSGGSANTTLNLSVQQPLFKGFDGEVALSGVRAAQFSLATSQRSFEQARVIVALDTISAFYQLIRDQDMFQLAQSLAQRLQRQALVAQSKERVGTANPMDTYRAEIVLKDAEAAANQARNAVAASGDRLKLLLELELDTALQLVVPSIPQLDDLDYEAQALMGRAELLQLQAEIDEAERSLRVAGSDLLPDVSLQVNYGQATSNDPFLNQYLPTTQKQWSVYLTASSDILRSAQRSNFRRAELRLKSLRLNIESKGAELRRQVRQQIALLAEAKQRITLRRQQIKQAESKLALAEVKFAHDMADNFSLLEAESELQRSRLNLLATEADYAVGVYNLKAIAGRLLDGFTRPSDLRKE